MIANRFAAQVFMLSTLTAVCGFVGCEPEKKTESVTISATAEPVIRRPPAELTESEARIYRTNVAEELVLKLTPKFRLLSESLKGKSTDLSPLFNETIEYAGLQDFDLNAAIAAQVIDETHIVAHVNWPLADELPALPAKGQDVWKQLTSQYQFNDTSFGILKGEVKDDADVFQMTSTFEGRFRDDKQRLFGVKAKQTLDWLPAGDGDWKIGKWHQDEFQIVEADMSLFENVTETAFPDDATRELLRRSSHEELLLDRTEGKPLLLSADLEHIHFSDWESSYHYPAVSVIDLDQDGWDDLFVLDRWGPAVLLRNNGNQTFTDVTESSGLDLKEAFANCALFFDIDNDGDSDVLIGRTVKPSLMYRNENGKFVPDEASNAALVDVKFVAAGAVADINRDGLSDVYLSTYCYATGKIEEWGPLAVSADDQLPLRMRMRRSHPYLDRGGPPNVMLLNRGGKLERVKIDENLKQWKNSFQSIWTDGDGDGDSDLYVCNDFSPDAFLRNDTPQGSFKPVFTDVTNEWISGNAMGFGMGASVGDYNSDGQLDLYISNMYSKAGNRVIEQMGGDVDPRIAVSAHGNFLYQKKGDKFEQVAGLEDGKQHVSKVGWSFGGQLADFNNDGKLDIYVPSGFFTAPERIDSQVDL